MPFEAERLRKGGPWRTLADHPRSVLSVGQSSLYPALHRLEQQGWIEAEWKDSDLGRPAKVYSLTRQGKKHWRLNSKPGTGFPPPCNYSFRTPEGLTSCDFAAFFLIVSERCFNARVEEELRCGFEIHVQKLAREFIAAGMPESEAPLAAKREFGSSAVNQEHCRDMRRRRFIDDLTRDLLFTLRTLKKSPGFTAMALLSLALSHNQYYLISLQAIDGVAMGIYGVLLTLITADLSKGSGRYNFVRGAVQAN
ncbi:MAG TPA: helix-turn-helix transcriptional regulator [Bryobacteraceae bacterium]|nr:helix-turn-helix transcriptional regulator [Bryobacteraceae bacterium]